MKYLPLREIDNVTDALNFETADCRLVGACDIYITKAAGSDKKLYKEIDASLESKHEAAVRFSASLSPPDADHAADALNLSRSSPFGPLKSISNRRTFAYLIATLNASHPDYDFSQFLRPSDFRREKSLKKVMDTIDTTMYSLRPKALSGASNNQKWALASSAPPEDDAPPTPRAADMANNITWTPKLWQSINKEMNLQECILYSYEPDDDPYDDDDDEPAIWSFHYFFFNKTKKRVCYLYLRALSLSSFSSDVFRTPRTPVTSGRTIDLSWAKADPGSAKRANYWLGRHAVGTVIGGWSEDEDDDDEDNDLRVLTDTEAMKYASEYSESPSPDLGRKRKAGRISDENGRGLDDDIAEAIEL